MIKRKLVTYLNNGLLISVVRTYHKDEFDYCYSYNKENDIIVSKTKISRPIKKWDGEHFLDYRGCCNDEKGAFLGRLMYKEFCVLVRDANPFVFTDFSNLSDQAFERLEKIAR